jgi:Holliday junction resolvasome RuvABC endonuclease subunit
MNKEGTIRALGVDVGTRIIGISEQTLEYKVVGEEILFKATLDDFYTLSIHSGKQWGEPQKIHFTHDFFIRGFPTVHERTNIAYIEEVPYVQNRLAYAALHRYTGCIAGALSYRGWNVKLINNSTWKSGILGEDYGKGKKPDIMAWAVAGNLPVDPDQLSEDSVDAICIAYYGIRQAANELSMQLLRKREKRNVAFSME